jgi:general secretion pathway protein B
MSYILDALKKAERERGIAQVPTLATVHDLREIAHIRLWLVLGVFVLGIAAVLWFLLPALRTDVQPISSRTRKPDHAANQPVVERIQESAAVPAALSSRQASGSAAPPAESGTNAPVATVARSAASERRLSSIAQAASAPPRNAAETVPLRPPPSDAGRNNSEGRLPSPDTAQPKSTSLKEAMAKMTMSVLLFSDDKAERLVFINGRKYVEGDYVEGDYLLESITSEGAVLSHGKERGILRPGPK